MIPNPKILLFQEYFSPGFLAGGIQTASFNLLSMPNHFNIRVVTSNFDLNEKKPYPQLVSDKWSYVKFGSRFFPIWYGKKGKITIKNFFYFFSYHPDWIYLQGVFGLRFFIIPLLIGKIIGIPIIICPHGMLDKGALRQKWIKKWMYFNFFWLLGLHKKIRWHATSAHEVRQINKIFGNNAVIHKIHLVASKNENKRLSPIKTSGLLRLLYYGRITPKKNLHLILSSLRNTNQHIYLTIIGPIGDLSYWRNTCIPLIQLLGRRVDYLGVISKMDNFSFLKLGHFMILPSDGENFSYSIFECLSNGVPVIISKHTPWGNIEKNLGGLIIEDLSKISDLLDNMLKMNEIDYKKYRHGALQCALEYIEEGNFLKNYHNLFLESE